MTHSNLTKSNSEIKELAVEILKANGQTMHYKELLEQALTRLNLPVDTEQIASALTEINLDSRFAYAGQGEWGLKSWMPSRPSRRLPTITLMNKALAYDDEDDKTDLEKESELDNCVDLDDIHDSEDLSEDEDGQDESEAEWTD